MPRRPPRETRTVQQLAPEILELLRRAAGPVRLEDLVLTHRHSMATRRRAVYRLRDLGAPISSDPRFGYELDDKGWQMPGPRVVVVTQEPEELPERVVFSGDLGAAKVTDLVRAIEDRGYHVTIRPVEKAG